MSYDESTTGKDDPTRAWGNPWQTPVAPTQRTVEPSVTRMTGVRWADVPEKEKWKMMLGIQLRSMAAGLLFWLGVLLVVAL